MNVYIKQHDGNWACNVDGEFHVLKLPVVKIALVSLVNGINKAHPEARISIGPDISPNPFVQFSINDASFRGYAYNWNGISTALLHPDCLVCLRCHGPAWWDIEGNGYRCMECNARKTVSKLKWTPPSDLSPRADVLRHGGWSDSDATVPKPTDPCKCGDNNPGWYKHDQRWICRGCGRYLTRAVPVVKQTEVIPF